MCVSACLLGRKSPVRAQTTITSTCLVPLRSKRHAGHGNVFSSDLRASEVAAVRAFGRPELQAPGMAPAWPMGVEATSCIERIGLSNRQDQRSHGRIEVPKLP